MSLLSRIRQGLSRTKEQIVARFDDIVRRADAPDRRSRALDVDTIEALEELLVSADLGVSATGRIIASVRAQNRDGASLRDMVKQEIRRVFDAVDRPVSAEHHEGRADRGRQRNRQDDHRRQAGERAQGWGLRPLVCCRHLSSRRSRQLEIWPGGPASSWCARGGADPAAVVFDAISSGRAKGCDPILVDTAGRLHTRVNLMQELQKIRRVVAREVEGAPQEVLLVLDATVGQNGLVQAREFMSAAGVNGIVLTKLDGTAKGGVAVAIANDLKLPIVRRRGRRDRRPRAFFPRRVRERAVRRDVVDADYMDRALFLAARGRGRTSPNPLVGAVVVAGDGVVVGQGFHRRAGEPHAEVLALEQSGPRARRDDDCTLEPCCHVGRTGPCVTKIVEAGISRLVAAIEDPNPLVNGKGFAHLREHGVHVEVGLGASAARVLNQPFLTLMRERRPFVIMKAAISRDGCLAEAEGRRTALTSAAANRHAHALRAEVDAIGVGAGTIRRTTRS